MKKLIFRNLIKDIAIFFLLVSISLTLIAWVIQAVNYLDIVSEDGHGFKVYFMFTLLSLPKLYGKLILFLYFISLFYIISKYQNNNEILIFWSHGIKKKEFVNVVLYFSIIILVFQLLINFFISPKTQDIARNYIRTSNIDYFPSLIGQKKFIDTVKNLTIFIENKNEDGVLEKIYIKDTATNNDPTTGGRSKIISANKGIFVKKDNQYFLTLINGTIANIDSKKTNILKFSETKLDLSDYGTKSITNPKIQEHHSIQMINCLIQYYKENIEYEIKSKYSDSMLVCNSDSIDAIYKEIYRRVMVPFYIFIVSFTASILILLSKNNIYYNKYKIFLFVAGTILVILTEVSHSYVSYNAKYNEILIMLPFLLIFIFYFFTFNKLNKNT